MRGYCAQVWRSVLAWIDLGVTERLYLEGAEDFDRVTGLSAETVQAKDVAGNITLRSGDVVEAIDNAWAHQQRNRQYAIKFRFLTTAGIGVEQGAPFGGGIGGLRLWRDTRLSADAAKRERDARTIADFLLAEGKVSAPVQAFLRTAADEQIWQQVIAPIEWDTEAEPVPKVIQQIEDRLVVLGHPLGVTPDKAEEVADHLYTVAYTTATREKGRDLTRADLLRRFHERTHVSLPVATANALFAAIPQHLVPAGQLPIAFGGKIRVIGRPPPLPARYYARRSVLSDITGRLLSYPVLVLQGGTGVGKSISAIGYTATSTSSWGWIDLRGTPASTLTDVLDRVIAELTTEVGLTHIVLDDIELPVDARSLETPLTRIRNILSERGGQLVITSSVVLPQRLALALALPATGTMPIPPFSRDEIAEFLIARGCPAPKVAGWWAAFVELHTIGHAQLVHARVATLEAQGFPTPDMQSLMTTPSDVVEARAESRHLITALDSPTRDLIYRLSLTVQALRKRQVLAIASQPPPVTEPGLAFDRLVGPWMEMVAEGHFRVSPLLRGVGQEVQGEAWATAMHSAIAHAILGLRTLSPSDVSSILFHATAAREWSAVTRLSFGILRSDNETWEALAQGADWFVAIGTGGAKRPETDVFSLFLIRLLQFRLAAEARDDEGATSVIACIDEELPATVEDMRLRLARHFFLGQVLLRTEVNLPIVQFVSIGLEYIRLAEELKGMLAGVYTSDFDRALAGPDGTPDLAAVAGFSLMSHLTDRHSLETLLETCEPVDANAVRRLLWFVGGQESTAQLIFNRVWLAEIKSAIPDWLSCREVFQRAYALARRWALPGLEQGAARAIARVTDENLNDPEEALRLADVMAAEIGRSPGQDDERASILLHKGETASALAIWRELLPRWAPAGEFDLQQTFSHRLAAVAAARLGQWSDAADWLRSARALADDVNYRAGLLVDEGFARWKGSDNRGALDCLVDGLTAIDQLPTDDTDENAYLLRKRTGHTVMWIASAAAGTPPTDFSEPPPACCSSLEPMNGAKLPLTPSDATWTHLVEFEFAAALGDEQFRAHEARLKASQYGLIRFKFDKLRLQQRLLSLALDDFVEVVGDWIEAMVLCQQYYYKPNELAPADPLPADAATPYRDQFGAETVLSVMLSAVFALAARGAITKELLDQWRASAARSGLSAIVVPWLAFVEALFVSNTLDAEAAVRDQSLSFAYQVVASIRVAADSATRPAGLLTIHNFWINVLPRTDAGLFVLADAEYLVTSAWRRLSESRFLLRAPAVTAPALQQACETVSSGWRKIGAVLTAACDAVPAAVPLEFLERFRNLK